MRMSTGTGFVPPTPVDNALLNRAEQLCLQPHLHFGNLVEQQRAAGRLLELADAPGESTGERALLMAEEFRTQGGFQGWRRS